MTYVKQNNMVLNTDTTDLERYRSQVRQAKRIKQLDATVNTMDQLSQKIDQLSAEVEQLKKIVLESNG